MTSSLERAFDHYWNIFMPPDVPKMVDQCYFHPEKNWRFDKALPDKLVFCELHGGGYMQGRHHREAGMVSDFEKLNAAVLMGWRPLYATTSMLSDNPEPFFRGLFDLLQQPIYYPNIEYSAWVSRIRNLTRVGDRVTSNGVSVRRGAAMRYGVELSSQTYQIRGKAGTPLVELQRQVLDFILCGGSDAATPATIREQTRDFAAQMSAF